MIEHDEIAGLEVEAIQLVAGLLGVHDVFEDDECGTLGLWGHALAYLAERTLVRGVGVGEEGFMEEILRRTRARRVVGEHREAYRTGPNLPNSSKSSSGETL